MARQTKFAVLLGIVALAVPAAQAALINEFVAYGQTSVTSGSNLVVATAGALTGSGGNVTLANGTTLQGAQGGGALAMGSTAIINGDLIFTGNITLGNTPTLVGDADTGGNFLSGNGGNLGSGTITAAGTITTGTSTFTGTANAGGTPTPFVAPTLPTATSFTGGGANQSVGNNGTITLNPGTYGALSFGNNGILDIDASAGDFIFDSITAGSGLTIRVNNDGSTINRILVVGNATFSGAVTFLVNLAAITVPSLADASRFLFEVHGNASFSGNAQVFGTVFAPNGSLAFGGGSDIRGSALAGTTLSFGENVGLEFSPFNFPGGGEIPEPTTIVLVSGGLAGLFLLRKRTVVR